MQFDLARGRENGFRAMYCSVSSDRAFCETLDIGQLVDATRRKMLEFGKTMSKSRQMRPNAGPEKPRIFRHRNGKTKQFEHFHESALDRPTSLAKTQTVL
ncbi:MAG: hypothetical protein KJN60_05440 [Boseongicola sp.]|nr:hypothetical protein [Boseongicola sp.]